MKPSRLVALAIILIISGCATAPPYNPFKVSDEQFFGKIKTIALTPVEIPAGVENPEKIKSKFESLIETKLREGGFKVLSSSQYDEVWKRMMKQLGGFFDPVTGKRDEEKYKAIKTHCLREMSAKFKADAVLYAGFKVFSVSFVYNKAKWQGATDTIVPSKGWQAYFSGSYNGTVPALSFGVGIVDMNEVEMYVNWGGIQVMSKISGGRLVPIPENEILAYEERNTAAVNSALDPLVKKPATPVGAKP